MKPKSQKTTAIGTTYAFSPNELARLDRAAVAFGESRTRLIRLILWEASASPAMRIWPDWRPLRAASYGDWLAKGERASLVLNSDETAHFKRAAKDAGFPTMQKWAHHNLTFYSSMILAFVDNLAYPPHDETRPYRAMIPDKGTRLITPHNDPRAPLAMARELEDTQDARELMKTWAAQPVNPLAGTLGDTLPPIELEPESEDDVSTYQPRGVLI